MTSNDVKRRDGERDPVERLLERAAPRPVPPPEEMQRVRDAVHAEWRAGVGRRQTRRRLAFAALAATVVAAAMLATRFVPVDPVQPTSVARIEKQLGAVYFVRENAGLVPIGDAQRLQAGQVLQTAKDSGLSLLVEDGVSLRLDEDSRIELISEDVVYLQRGRLYVDTPGAHAASALAIRTDQGSITHLGTQYMVAIAGDELTVSVRQGEVRISGRYHDTAAAVGDRVTLRGTNRPLVDRVPTHSGPWRWTESLSPSFDVDGMSADGFLEWVSQETGYELAYDDDGARRIADETILKGVVDKDPRTELRLRLLTMDLDYDLDDARGLIRVRSPGP